MATSDEAAMSVLKNFIGAKTSRGIHIEAAGHRRLDLGIGSPRCIASPHLGEGLVGRKPEVSVESAQDPQVGFAYGPHDAATCAAVDREQRAQRRRERDERASYAPGSQRTGATEQTAPVPTPRRLRRGGGEPLTPAVSHAHVRA